MDAHTAVPPLVPTRMVNEFVYCQRLFYLEWVQAQFVSNDDVIAGQFLHRTVDTPHGTPDADRPEAWQRATSVELSSESIGVSARLDVVENRDGEVRPVDFKKGSPAPNDRRVWDADLIQLGLQVLLLREAGFRCTHGEIYYATTRERVAVEIDAPTETWIRDQLHQLREVASRDVPPPPLVHSPKCPRCSLVGICLPDEMNVLGRHRDQDGTPPRVIVRDPDQRPLYVTEPGSFVGLDHERVVVSRNRSQLTSVRFLDISQICVFGNVQVSTALLRECFQRGIPVAWFSYGGWLQGVATGMIGKNVDLRRRQVAIAGQGGLPIAKAMVCGKIRNSRTLLRRNGTRAAAVAVGQLARLLGDLDSVNSTASLLGIEGTAARLYFAAFSTMLKGAEALPGRSFDFRDRNRRPPRDPVNCLLSYLYALLVKDLVSTCHLVGFDPFLGFYHRPRFGRPALALDLAEEFRPLVADSVAVSVINNGEIHPEHFVVRSPGVALTAAGRRIVLRAYERRLEQEIRHPALGYRVSYRRVLDLQTRLLAAYVIGEISAYAPMVTR